MKHVALILLFASSLLVHGQYNKMAPWTTSADTQKASSPQTIEQINAAFEAYWKDRDPSKKGSGFKPHQRWAEFWQHFVDKNGQIINPEELWAYWAQEANMAQSDFSNWYSIGPFTTNVKKGQGRVNTFIIDPNNPEVFYVGAPSGGLWKSTDSGANWRPIADQLPQIGVSGIAIDPKNSDIIYIATGDDDALDTYSVGVLKSTDGGESWNKTGLDLSSTKAVTSEIYIHPEDSNILWVATDTGFFKTTDAGKNWDYKISINIIDIKLKPGDPDVIYAVSPSKFYKSTDGGETFKVVSSGLPTSSGRFAIDVSPADPERVYLLSAKTSTDDYAFQGLYRSDNSGDSFQKTGESKDIFGSSQAWYDMALTVSPQDADMVFVGVLDIWRSTNGGDAFYQKNRWYDSSDPAYTHADIHFMRYFNGKLYAGTDGGIYESSDDADSFTDLTETMNISQYYRIATARRKADRVVGGLQDNGGFAYSSEQWHQYHGGDGMDCVIDPNDENIYYGFTQFGGSLNITYNGGVTEGGTVTRAPKAETDPDRGDSGGRWITPLVADNQGNLYAAYSRVYKLVNGDWEPHSPRMFGGDLNQMALAPGNDQVMYVSRFNRLFKSVDTGKSFEELETVFNSNISSISISDQDENVLYVSTIGTGGQIMRSKDGGATWEDYTKNLPEGPKLVVKHQNQSVSNDLYVGNATGVFHINDNMSSWERFDSGLPNAPVFDLEINADDATITAGTYGRGVWQSRIEVNQADRDVSLLSIDTNNSVQCEEVYPIITVKNNGKQSLNEVEVEYYIDEQKFSFVYTSSIAPDVTRVINLPPAGGISTGIHDLTVEVSTSNDAFQSNNMLFSDFIRNNAGEGQYVNTFGDVNPDEWLTETQGSPTKLWEKGEVTSSKLGGKFDQSYATNLDGNYFDETTAYLISPCYDLSTLENPILKFDMVFDLELDWDVIYVEYSLDKGKNWEILGSADDPNWYNSDFIDPLRPITVGKQWTGTNLLPQGYSYNLAELASESSVIFRFVFASDWASNQEGVVIDNFSIDASAVLAAEEFEKYNYKLYPNPSSDLFYIQRPSVEPMSLSVYDVRGRLVLEQAQINTTFHSIDLTSMRPGLYFLKITEGNKQLATTIMKQ